MAKAREYESAAALIELLREQGQNLMERFYYPDANLPRLAYRSVAQNTYRGFRGLKPAKPSVAFRTFTSSRITPQAMEVIAAVRDQDTFDAARRSLAADLTDHWQTQTKHVLEFGPCVKLTNLLLKSVVRWSGLTESDRRRLIPFLHVPLDKFSLLAIRRFAHDGSLGPRVIIPRNPAPSMGFVRTEEQYTGIQQIMRAIASEAGVPLICVDLLAWDSAHTVGGTC